MKQLRKLRDWGLKPLSLVVKRSRLLAVESFKLLDHWLIRPRTQRRFLRIKITIGQGCRWTLIWMSMRLIKRQSLHWRRSLVLLNRQRIPRKEKAIIKKRPSFLVSRSSPSRPGWLLIHPLRGSTVTSRMLIWSLKSWLRQTWRLMP